MKNLILMIVSSLISLNSFGSEKCDERSALRGVSRFYPFTSFEDTNLPKIRTTARVFEFSDDKDDYSAICFNWPDPVYKHGNKQSCKGWCILPRADISSALSLRQMDTAIKRCSTCFNKKGNDQNPCSDIVLLTKSNQEFKLGTGDKTLLFQIGSKGNLLIFQTANNLKDLRKPYLSLTRESKYFVKNKLELQVRSVADTGYFNTASLNLNKADVTHKISAQSMTQREEDIPDSNPIDGQRSCAVVQVKTTACPENIEEFESSNYLSNTYSCNLKTAKKHDFKGSGTAGVN